MLSIRLQQLKIKTWYIFHLAIGVCFCSGLLAGPVGLPDSARPGAVRPDTETPKIPKEAPEVLQPSELTDIPAVIDRPFDPDECPCLLVEKFRLLDAVDMDEFGIKIAEIEAILDEQIAQQPETGFSIGQLEKVARTVRDYYREHGLILAQVVVPVQTVQVATVDLQVYVGILGRVIAEGNEMYSATVLEKAFTPLIGKPINKAEIEATLLTLTDYPGLSVFGVFQPGQLVGTADIVLKVQEEKRFDVAMRVDNQGTRETGRFRFRTYIDWNNITGGADRLTMGIQQTYQPKNNVFKNIEYERFLSTHYKFKAAWDRNKFDVGGEFEELGIHAETEHYTASVQRIFKRSRQGNLFGEVGYTYETSNTSTSGTPTNEDRMSVFFAKMDFDFVDSFSLTSEPGGGINIGSLEFRRGVNDIFGAMASSSGALEKRAGFKPSRQGGSGTFAAGMFTKLFATYTRLQTLIKNQNLLFRAEWQWSDDLLVPLEQYSAGGADNVRAFPPAQILWDKAAFLSLEWLINAPFIADKVAFENRTWGELLQFSMFYDFAVGTVNDPLPTDDDGYENIKGAGVGLNFNMPGTISTRLMWAWEIGGDKVGNERSTQFWGDFTYFF